MKHKTTKHLLFFLLICGLLFSFKTKENQQDNFEKTIIEVVKAFKKKDASILNGLILNDKGLIVLFKRGVADEYSKTGKIDFNHPIPEYLPYSDFSTDFNLKFESLPTFDCNSMKWSKSGLYCDTIKHDNLLSQTAQNLKKYRGDKIAESEIKSFIELEKNSHRVVLSDKAGGELVFYLTLVNNKWYLSILDRVTSDCSA